MKLEHLKIVAESKYLRGYGEPPVDVYVGTVKFKNGTGNIEVVLTEAQLRGIIDFVGEAMIAATKETAKLMAASILEESGQLKIV